jgi:hypothetical protein
MRNLQPRLIATKALLGVAGAFLAGAAVAAPAGVVAPASVVTPAKAAVESPASAGTVVQSDGPLLVQNADGRTRVIARGAVVDVGDTIVTGNGSYAEIRFADNSDAIVEPDTQLTIDAFWYDASRADSGEARWALSKGGMQVTSGAISTRGTGRHLIATPYGTIAVAPSKFTVTVTPVAATRAGLSTRVYLAANETGVVSDSPQPIILATTFVGQYIPPPPTGGTSPGTLPATKTPSSGALPPVLPGGITPPGGGSTGLPPTGSGPTPPALPPGLHLQVTDGAIVVTNNGGSLGFQAGQFGFVPSVNQPPVIVPSNPGIQFTPPPSFNSGSGGPTANNGPGQGQATDCIVR